MSKITKKTVQALLALIHDGEIRAAAFKNDDLTTHLLKEGCIRQKRLTKSSSRYILLDEKSLRICCADYDVKLKNLEMAYEDYKSGNLHMKPSDEILRYGHDHVRSRNLWKGFFVKADTDLLATLDGKPVSFFAGQAILVEDGNSFSVQGIETMRLWIVENYECFSNTCWLERFNIPKGHNVIICRWPTSKQGRESYSGWKAKEKRYFGDYDLAGINIFQTEYERLIGPDAFFIPETFSEDITHGSNEQFLKQKEKYSKLKTHDARIGRCMKQILEQQKGLSQEFYVHKKG